MRLRKRKERKPAHTIWIRDEQSGVVGRLFAEGLSRMEISLGLDLKGGMNVILEVSVPEVVKALADHKETRHSTRR